MIRALELENFKAFGQRTRIEFAPITLIYGQNSAGKSSILNALNLLKQTRMGREQGALLLPRAEGGLVDLGSFHELLHDHDSNKTLAIRVDVDAGRRRRPTSEPDDDLGPLGIEFGFHRKGNDSDVSLEYVNAYSGGDRRPALRFVPVTLTEADIRTMRHFYYWRGERRSPKNVKAVMCDHVSDALDFWRPRYQQAKLHAAEIVALLKLMKEGPLDNGVQQANIDSAIRFYGSDFSLAHFMERRRAAELGAKAVLDGFIPSPSQLPDSWLHPESMAWRYRRNNGVLRQLFDVGDVLFQAGRLLDLALERLFPLGPYRRAPERLYIFTGTTPADVGYSGNLLPDLLFRKRSLVKETNSWLDRLDVGYHIEISPVGTPSNDLFEVRLRDTRRSKPTSIALPDVGFGISQMLPFIVQTLASADQTITIEQPEVHVHPKLQADLADLLIAGIQPDRNHRYIVETHSEHLILRLLRRIRETTENTLPFGTPKLSPTDVSVVYLQRGPEGATVDHLRIDDDGNFVDQWPQGFFDERFTEIYGA